MARPYGKTPTVHTRWFRIRLRALSGGDSWNFGCLAGGKSVSPESCRRCRGRRHPDSLIRVRVGGWSVVSLLLLTATFLFFLAKF